MLFRNLACCIEIPLGSFSRKWHQYVTVASKIPRWSYTTERNQWGAKAEAMPQTEFQCWHHKRQGSHTCSVNKVNSISQAWPIQNPRDGFHSPSGWCTPCPIMRQDQPPPSREGRTRVRHPWQEGHPGLCPIPLAHSSSQTSWGYPCRMHSRTRKQRHPDAGGLEKQIQAPVSLHTSKRCFWISHLILTTT